jgi:Disulphide bond corrector protein DsbC
MMWRGLLRFLSFFLCAGLLGHSDELLSSRTTSYVLADPVSLVMIVPGKPSTVTLRFRIAHGYHINSNRPSSDLLIPTTLKLQPPSDLMAGKVTYPAGKDLAFPFSPDEKLSVYTDEFSVQALLSAVNKASPGKFTVHGELRYQACNDNACFPPKTVPLQFDVKVETRPAAQSRHGGQSPHIRRYAASENN